MLVTEPADIERDLLRLDAELHKLEGEYNMFFAGQRPRPPWETRSRVEAMVKRLDRGYVQSHVERFRFNTLQARFVTFADLWDRGLRAREEGRPGPFAHAASSARKPQHPADRIVHVTTLADPVKDLDKIHELYERLTEAHREAGEDAVPFHKFVHLVRDQVTRLRKGGSPEVAFRVALKQGKVSLTARALKGIKARR